MQPLPIAHASATRAALWRLLGEHRTGFALAVLSLAAGAAAGALSPLILGAVVDTLTGAESNQLPSLFVFLTCVVIAQACVAALSRIAVAAVGERMLARLRLSLIAHILRLPERRVEAAGSGDVVARVSDDVAVVGETVSSIVPQTAAAAFAILAAAAGMGVIDPRLMLVALVVLPIQWFALRLHLRRSQPVYRASRAAAGERSRRILEAVDAHQTITAFGLSPRSAAAVDEAAVKAARLTESAVRLGARFWGRLNLAEFAGLSALLVLGFLLVQHGSISVGAATAAALLFLNLFGPLGTVVASFDELQRAAASLARLVGVLEEPAPPANSRGENDGSVGLDVAEVRFAYDTTPVVDGVTVSIGAGEHLAIVGASGAGKSTLAALICGSLHPTAGTIGFRDDPAPRVAFLAQEQHVFAGSVAENLRLAQPSASDAELRAALDDVGALSWLDRIESGLACRVGEGGRQLSDVQRQQLALARACLLRPQFLVLDEAASEGRSADGRVLDRAAARIAKRQTTVTIAHRLEQASIADRILVMDAGRIVEAGVHAELLAADGRYAELWRAAHR